MSVPKEIVPHEVTVHREAMATVFTATIFHEDMTYARQAAREALDELERLEERLSRFAPTSDISRLHGAAPGTAVLVHPDTFDCLRLAEQIRRDTEGAFDVGYRSGRLPSGESRFLLEDDRPAVRVVQDRLQLDLGGVGKGFALDRVAAFLSNWDLSVFGLSASTSTHLYGDACPGMVGWPVTLDTQPKRIRLRLKRQAVSASGTSVRGGHIIDSRTGRAAGARRAWAVAPTAAMADALSTAFLVMTRGEIDVYCRHRKTCQGFIVSG